MSARRTKKTKKTQKPERDYTGDARDNWRRRGRRENSIDRNSSETFVCVLCVKKKYNVPARRRRTCCSRTRRRWPWFLFLLMKCVVCVCPREKTVREFNSREKEAAENLGCRV